LKTLLPVTQLYSLFGKIPVLVVDWQTFRFPKLYQFRITEEWSQQSLLLFFTLVWGTYDSFLKKC